mmetsp:Transcript_11937/g.17120  ORF Transcript_11937/g.17120 Transcript_11937/m.17120 type:complete len:209 (+) Transcript_11937:162-788(+)
MLRPAHHVSLLLGVPCFFSLVCQGGRHWLARVMHGSPSSLLLRLAPTARRSGCCPGSWPAPRPTASGSGALTAFFVAVAFCFLVAATHAQGEHHGQNVHPVFGEERLGWFLFSTLPLTIGAQALGLLHSFSGLSREKSCLVHLADGAWPLYRVRDCHGGIEKELLGNKLGRCGVWAMRCHGGYSVRERSQRSIRGESQLQMLLEPRFH